MTPTIFHGLTPAARAAGWQTLFVDFESRFDNTIKLGFRHQTGEEYVRDPRFEVLCACILKDDDESVDAFGPDDLVGYFNGIDWSKTLFVAHNVQFDGFILTEHFGHRPAMLADTIAIARCLYPNLDGGYSLNALSKRFLGGTGKFGRVDPYEGYDREFFDAHPEVFAEYLRYCAKDVFLLRELYLKLLGEGRMTRMEMNVTSEILRASTDSTLRVLRGPAEAYADQREAEYEAVSHFADDETFAGALRAAGVEPETKRNKRGEDQYCFAQTDPFMREQAAGGDAAVRTLVEQRFMAKSTSERTKARRFAGIASRGVLPVSLMPYGAHTGRDSGGGSINLQNMERKSPLRAAIAPLDGHKLVVADAAQIECRVLNYLAGQDSVVDAFAEGRDVYCETGEVLFGRPISKADDPELRQQAKVVELACGYGLGWRTLKARLEAEDLVVSDEDAERFVAGYKQSHPKVVDFWWQWEAMLQHMQMMPRDEWTESRVGRMDFPFRLGRIRLPAGRELHYPNLRKQGREFTYDKLYKLRCTRAKTYGGSMTENVVQALARDITFGHDYLFRQTPVGKQCRLALRIHDELVYTCPEAVAQEAFETLCGVMGRPPEWMPELPLLGEGGVGDTLADCK